METRVKSLLQQMTITEKIAQLQQLAGEFYEESGEITGPLTELNISEAIVNNAGSILGTTGSEEVIRIQTEYLKKNRLGIPLLFMADVVHGYKSIFPIPLGLGCSWNEELAEESAKVAAIEAASSGCHVTFAPMVDLVRDPRWGRVMESTGEDPFLNSRYAQAFTKGFQGESLKNEYETVAACVKHFAAYGAPEGGREYNTVNMSERQLREMYLPAYKAALDVGCKLVMTSFNTVDFIPATVNKWLMRKVLRSEYDFKGVLISDWSAMLEVIAHGVAADNREVAQKSLEAGVDIEMMTSTYANNLEALIEDGSLSITLLDEAVERILQLKEELGLFDNPFRGADIEHEKMVVRSAKHLDATYRAATESMVLLKNTGVLPLKKESKIALVGPVADSGDILGSWSWKGDKTKTVTLLDGMQAHSDNLVYAKGSEIQTATDAEIEAAVVAAKDCELVIAAIGEKADMSGEAHSRADITVPVAQMKLLRALKAAGHRIVAVLFSGRPLDIRELTELTDAILIAWFPGSEGGRAIADVLYGTVIPSGKLSMSFPYAVGQIPIYYNAYNTGRPFPQDGRILGGFDYVSKYDDIPNAPLYAFGHGLSYATFMYKNPSLSNDELTEKAPIEISVEVTNTSEYTAKEVVQLYIRDHTGSVVRPLKELKAFDKITLTPHETKTVSFTITSEMLKFWDENMEFVAEKGTFSAFIGSSSLDVTEHLFYLV